MSNNMQTVQNAYAAFGQGDIPGLLSFCAEDISWQVPEIENASFAGKRQGLTAVGEFFVALVAEENITMFEPTEFIDGGERIVVLGHSAATVNETGRSYETDWVHVFTVRDGKIAGFVEFFDNAAATRAFQKATTA